MNSEILLVGSREFLRLWGLLGIAGKEVDAQPSFEALKNVDAAGARIIFYEENLLDGLTASQKKYFEESAEPYWLPLPQAR